MAEQRVVFDTMGTTVSLILVTEDDPEPAARAAEREFVERDELFSLYRPESEATAVASGALSPDAASMAYREALALARRWERWSAGAFTPERPDRSLDLSGVVKAQAIEAAGAALDAAGIPAWCVNAGGDVLARGSRSDGRPWVVGIVDPDDDQELLSQATLSAGKPAIATSGVAERGEHVWRQATEVELTQVSVVASDIVTADVLATAILAGGLPLLDRAIKEYAVEAIACASGGRLWTTPAFRK